MSNKLPPKPPQQQRKGGINIFMIYGILFLVIIGFSMFQGGESPVRSNWKAVSEMLAKGDIEKIEVANHETAKVYLKKDKIERYRKMDEYAAMPETGVQLVFNIGSVEILDSDIKAVEAESGQDAIEITYVQSRSIWDWLMQYGFIILMVLFLFMMMRSASRAASGGAGGGLGGGGIFNVGRAKPTTADKKGEKVTFKDVAGLAEAKVEVMEIVDFLRQPEKYKELGGKIPKGALLVGPPGTGKTLLAKAVAGEADVPFLSMSGSDFVEMFVGVGASRVRDLFRQAKEKAPCIVFIDEIDAVGRARGKNAGFSGNDERENTLNQLLTEMDGFGTNSGVIILAATNRADILDKALMRAGRFDRQIEVGLPDIKEREEIFAVHLKGLKLGSDFTREFLAKQTPGFSGADIANVCNEAALIAARHNKKLVERADFLAAIDRIVGGLEKKNKIISPAEKRRIAFHEAGHATVGWIREHANPLIKVTIIPRGQALGAAWYLPEERQITTREQLVDEMAATLGGRASEQLTFGTISTGALNDLERATKQAYAMVSYFGMSEGIGNRSYYDSTGSEMGFTKPYSEQTAQLIDGEAKKLLDDAYKLASTTLQEHNEGLHRLAGLLLEKEVVFAEDLEEIFGARKKSEN